MTPSSNQLKLSEVVKYIRDRYGVTVARQTIYNWADPDKGRNWEHLRTTEQTRPGKRPIRVTTVDDVDEFLRRAGDGRYPISFVLPG